MYVALRIPQTTLLGSCTAAQCKNKPSLELFLNFYHRYLMEAGKKYGKQNGEILYVSVFYCVETLEE